jgi:hypothetical protein
MQPTIGPPPLLSHSPPGEVGQAAAVRQAQVGDATQALGSATHEGDGSGSQPGQPGMHPASFDGQ